MRQTVSFIGQRSATLALEVGRAVTAPGSGVTLSIRTHARSGPNRRSWQGFPPNLVGGRCPAGSLLAELPSCRDGPTVSAEQARLDCRCSPAAGAQTP